MKYFAALFLSLLAAGLLPAQNAVVLEVANIVQSAKGSAGEWTPAAKDQTLAVRDRIRTRQRSRATVRLTDLYTMRLEQFTTVEITPVLLQGNRAQLNLTNGAVFLFSREKTGEIGIKTPTANGALRGTQLLARVEDGGRTFFQVLEGQVEMSNDHGSLTLNPGEAGEAHPGEAPRRTAVILAKNLLQWALYYPAVLDPAALGLDAAEEKRFADSLKAYRKGDVLGALEKLPASRLARAGTPRRAAHADSPASRAYEAGVLLAVGRVDEAQERLAAVPPEHPGRRALERVIAAVTFEEQPDWPLDGLATASEAVAESYYQQSRSRLKEARAAARHATKLSPESGYAWTRLAELEFSFGKSGPAGDALFRAMVHTPANAQAHALEGFVLSSENRVRRARASFEKAIALDAGLGNGWLGLGLTKIKRGDQEEGLRDLQTAATVEPTVSLFHSYLGKALSAAGMKEEARKDLELAKQLDPRDPTPWLYSALENQLRNQPNPAIHDLHESIRLNDNRRVYRSGLLLDQDRAVRGANLAKIYQNAGLRDVALWEAARAVDHDYANAASHLFLANAFDALRDPKRISLRYETPWFNELLLANLLSPVGGGPLSQFVSQQEYSKLLEADGVGGNVTTEWLSTNELATNGSLFGTYGPVSLGIDGSYWKYNGDRTNAEASRAEIYAQLKWQVTPGDMFYFLGKWQDQKSGDNFETYDNLPVSPGFDFEEKQHPGLLLAGWNHRWSPSQTTLLLAGRLAAEQRLRDPLSTQRLLLRDTEHMRPGFLSLDEYGFDQFTNQSFNDWLNPPVTLGLDFETMNYSQAFLDEIAPYLNQGKVTGVSAAPFTFDTRREFEIHTFEAQHIWQTEYNTLLLGGRYQEGEFITDAELNVIRPTFFGAFPTPAVRQHLVTDFRRKNFYAYDFLKPFPWLTLIGGVSYDEIEHPDNFRNPPVSDGERHDRKVSGKYGFILSPSPWLTVRGAYTEGLGGVTFDESVRLEPVQVAGFNQAYRTLISESLAGSVETPEYEIMGLSVEGRLPTNTWWGVSGNRVQQDVERTVGVFSGYDLALLPNSPAYFPGGMRERLDYEENSFSASLGQLLGSQFALGANYRVTRSRLRRSYPDLPARLMAPAEAPVAVDAAPADGEALTVIDEPAPAGETAEETIPVREDYFHYTDEATLQELSLHLHWNSPSGFFARLEANWYAQDLADAPKGLPAGALSRVGDDFWQFNAMVGYRFRRNMSEISFGVLNLNDTDYRLSPLNPFNSIPRERSFVFRCRMSF